MHLNEMAKQSLICHHLCLTGEAQRGWWPHAGEASIAVISPELLCRGAGRRWAGGVGQKTILASPKPCAWLLSVEVGRSASVKKPFLGKPPEGDGRGHV